MGHSQTESVTRAEMGFNMKCEACHRLSLLLICDSCSETKETHWVVSCQLHSRPSSVLTEQVTDPHKPVTASCAQTRPLTQPLQPPLLDLLSGRLLLCVIVWCHWHTPLLPDHKENVDILSLKAAVATRAISC